jgi:hypothetical protein
MRREAGQFAGKQANSQGPPNLNGRTPAPGPGRPGSLRGLNQGAIQNGTVAAARGGVEAGLGRAKAGPCQGWADLGLPVAAFNLKLKSESPSESLGRDRRRDGALWRLAS